MPPEEPLKGSSLCIYGMDRPAADKTISAAQIGTGNARSSLDVTGDIHIGIAELNEKPNIFLFGDTTDNKDGLRVHYNAKQKIGVIDVKGNSLRLRGESVEKGEGQTDQLCIDLSNGSIDITGNFRLSDSGDLLLVAKDDDPGDIVFQDWESQQKGRIWSNPNKGSGLFLSSGDNVADVAIDAGGNVGIGTTEPGAKLHVYDTTADVKIAVDASAEHEAGFVLSSGHNREWEIYRPRSSGDLRFWESGVGDRVTFQAGGNVGIGTTRPQARFHVMGDACIAENEAQDPIKMTGGAGHLLFWCHDLHIGHKERRGEPGRALVDLGDTLILNYGPDWTNVETHGHATNFSSRDVKEDIATLTFEYAEQLLADLMPVSFKYTHDPKSESRLGFIAEDVPSIVGATNHKSVNPLGIIAILTRVVKEQQQVLANLVAQVRALQAQQGS